MDRVHALEHPSNTEQGPGKIFGIGTLLIGLCSFAQLVVMAMDPIGFAFVAPKVLALLIVAIVFLLAMIASLGELVALMCARSTRVIHGLEHACINVLRERGLLSLGGQTVPGRYVIEVANDGHATPETVRESARDAIRRVAGGEHKLAYSPRCGTSLLVALFLVVLVVVGGAVIGLAAGTEPRVITTLTALVGLVMWLVARPLGLLAQRFLTVSTRFGSAHITGFVHTVSADGARARFLVSISVSDETAPAWLWQRDRR